MQKGQLIQKSGAWYVRYYEGKERRTKHLGYVADYPTRTSVEPVLQAEMRAVNGAKLPSSTLEGFIQENYLPWVRENLRPSVLRGYQSLFDCYVKGREVCQMRVREYNTHYGQRILDTIATERLLAKTTLQHLKFFLSGAFIYACQCGLRESNPMKETRLPKRAKPSRETYAYSLDEVQKMLAVVGDKHLRAALATAAFTGLRLAELQGLRWGDYEGDRLYVRRSAWREIVSETKTIYSKNWVPVLPCLKVILDEWKAEAVSEEMFHRLDHFHRREQLKKMLKPLGMEWRGWHALRRGLASTLFELGIDDLTVQRILRHAKVTVTREHYIKVRDSKMESAMERLGESLDTTTEAVAS